VMSLAGLVCCVSYQVATLFERVLGRFEHEHYAIDIGTELGGDSRSVPANGGAQNREEPRTRWQTIPGSHGTSEGRGRTGNVGSDSKMAAVQRTVGRRLRQAVRP
jgi:hypothetical protein